MRKDDSGIHEWCKHTKNAAGGKWGVNKRVRKHAKDALTKQERKPHDRIPDSNSSTP